MLSTTHLQLFPRCNEFLVHCVWRGRTLNCSDVKTALRQVVTESGPCCLFNTFFNNSDKFSFSYFFFATWFWKHFVNWIKFFWKIQRKHVSSTAYGVNSGLILYLNLSVADYFHTTEPFIGVRVSVFSLIFWIFELIFFHYLIIASIKGTTFSSWCKNWSISG